MLSHSSSIQVAGAAVLAHSSGGSGSRTARGSIGEEGDASGRPQELVLFTVGKGESFHPNSGAKGMYKRLKTKFKVGRWVGLWHVARDGGSVGGS